jgi:probable phosphoglycerate mutase
VSRRLVLLRHGQTAHNRTKRIQGQLDVELDQVGHAQAAAVAPTVAALGPALLWSSDLLRARDTAGYIADATGLAPSYDVRLREFHLGERQDLTHEEYAALAPAEFERFRRGDYDVVPGAETAADVGARMGAVLGDLLAALEPGQTGVAVSHGAAIRVAVGALLGWPEQQFHSLAALGNCARVVVRDHLDDGVLRLEAYNDAVGTPDFASLGSVG